MSMPASLLRVPDNIRGHQLRDEEKNSLCTGESIHLKDLVSKKGESYNLLIRADAYKNGIAYDFANKNGEVLSRRQDMVPERIKNIGLTVLQQNALSKGKVLEIKGILSKDGSNVFAADVKWDTEQKKIIFDPLGKWKKEKVKQTKDRKQVHPQQQFQTLSQDNDQAVQEAKRNCEEKQSKGMKI